MHDWLWRYGFDEASGNFQVSNPSGNGAGGDPVLAEAQDGFNNGCLDNAMPPNPIRCLNNANFGTNADGSTARMQMYMWARPNRPYRDGSMDGDVIAHEYGHGVSQRLVPNGLSGGNSAINQAGSLNEGWSDTISFLRWGDDVVGEYVTGNAARGIRSSAYATHPDTYGDYSLGVDLAAPQRRDLGRGPLRGADPAGHQHHSPAGPRRDAGHAQRPQPDVPRRPRRGDRQRPGRQRRRQPVRAVDGVRRQRDGGERGVQRPARGAHRGLHHPRRLRADADAGGPYSTPEGTNVALDGTGSAAGSHPSAGALTAFEWDLDNDGQYDDATGPNPDFTAVGQDRVAAIGLRVTDAWGNTATDSSTVTVTNVLPTVSIDPIPPIDEFGTTTVSGVISDPGWLDPLTATIDFDDGNGAQALAGVVENVRPDATFSFSVDNQYGDDGTFAVRVTGFDDDGSSSSVSNAVVANLDPTVAIDSSGEQVYDGVSAFVAEAGEDVTVPVGTTDPGSDDLTVTWDWDDGSSDVQTTLVNPPAPDPPKSPSVQPRDESLSATHAFVDACVYDLEVTSVDDDGGSATDTATVVITGNADVSKGSGWWLNQMRPKPPDDFSTAELECYLAIVGFFSMVFPDGMTRADGESILHAPAKSPEQVIFDEHAMAAWLNFANGSVNLDTPVDTDGDGVDESTFGDAMFAAESVRINGTATSNEVKAQKDIVERITLTSAP